MADNAEHQSSLQTEFMQDERSPDAQTGLNALEALKEEEQQAKIEIRSQISELNRNASRKDLTKSLHLPRIKSNVDVASGGSIDSSVVKVEVHKSVLPGTQAQEMRLMMVHHAMETEEQDNRDLLMKMRARLDAVNLRMPAAEVRFKNLSADAHVNVGSAGMPTFINFFRESIVDLLSAAHLTSGGKEPLSILNNVSGVLKPGKFTLLLGPPAGGKTTFLKALSGAGGAGGISIKGEILYNGEPLSDFQPRRTSAYVDEIDLHQAEFTVRETFDMAARCLGAGHMPAYSAELRKREEEIGIHPDPVVAAMMDAMSLEGHKHSIMTDLTLRILGLEVCSETQIGNEMIRGVSGGQKKRVTTGELLVGPARVLLMDSISTGLDSSTTHLIISCLRNICHLLDTTVCVSLLQPPPEVFDLFDDVMVLSEGYLIYHGPKEEIPGFFNSLGFQIPERKEVADFLQEITSRKDQGQYRIDQSKKDEFVPVKEIYNAFQTSSMGQTMSADLATPALPPPLAVTSDGNKSKVLAPFATDPLVRKRYALGNWQVFRAMADRDSLLFSRNSFLYIFQEFQTCLVGAMATTLFLKVNYTKSTFQDGQVYLGLLFFCAMTAMWNVFAEMGTMCFSLPVFFKQRSMQLYPAWAFTLPAAVMRLPFSLLDATLFSCIMYFPTGLALQPSKFFIFWTFHILFSQVGVTMFRFVGALGRTFEVANSYGNLVVILQMVLSGFVMSKALIPNWWVWMYWASPLTYAQQAYFLNEFTSSDWATIVEYNGQNVTLGNAVLMSHQLWTNPNMIWVSALVLIGYWFLFNALTALVLSYTPSPGPAVPSFSKAFLQRRILNVNGGELSDAHRSSIELNDHSAAKKGTQVVAEGGKGVTMPFSPASVCFHGIKYTVPMPAGAGKEGEKDLVILSDITGSFRPGVLTALMGVSGAGKTTLMDVLAGRKTVGVITGDIKVNGHKKNQAHFASIAGYVEQTDIHMPRTTVREAVQISGLLRLHNTSKDQIELFVDEVMSLVELTPLAKSIVGAPGQFGLSVEQRKRLTIAVELVANPSIIFMDEPTSGLDARAAAIVMRAVRNTVNTGRTVVCTIHQPSVDIFDAFDELLLLKRGGRTIYHGPIGSRATDLIAYFSSTHAAVKPCPDGLNPATWMLEITALRPEARLGIDFADIYAESDLSKRNEDLVKELSVPSGAEPTTLPDQFAQPFSAQFMALMNRCLLDYWRNPGYNAVRIVFCVVLGLLLGSIYYQAGYNTSNPNAVINIMGALFLCMVFMGYGNCSGVFPIIANGRTVFYRERAAGMYSVEAFALSAALVELPYVTLQAAIYSIIVFFMIGFKISAANFFWFFFFQWLCLIFFTYFGMMLIACLPILPLAQIVSILFLNFFFLFGGFFIPYPNFPVWWKWIYWLDPLSYSIYGIIGSQFSNDQSPVNLPDGSTVTVSQFLATYLNFTSSFFPYCALIMIGFIVFFWTIFVYATKNFNFNRR